jgi:hypothetical protein
VLEFTGPTEKDKRLPYRTPRIFEVRYPREIRSAADRDNWIKAMMLDARMSARDRLILTRLVMHLNLKSGRLDPSLWLLATECSIPGNCETAERVVRRSLEKAEKLGWIRRWRRHGGARLNRSNYYRLTIPDDVFAPAARPKPPRRFTREEIDVVYMALAYTQRADVAAIMGFVLSNPHLETGLTSINGATVANILKEAGSRAGLRIGTDYLTEEEYQRWDSALEELVDDSVMRDAIRPDKFNRSDRTPVSGRPDTSVLPNTEEEHGR